MDVALTPAALPTRHEIRTRWPASPWVLAVLLGEAGRSWWEEGVRRFGAAPVLAAGARLEAVALATVLARGGGALVEAGFYALYWRARGLTLPYWRFAAVIALISLADAFAASAVGLVHRLSASPPAWTALLTGWSALAHGPAGWSAGARAAAGDLSLFTALRVGATALAQREALGVPLARPLALTAGAWLATRALAWFTADLLQGRSPLP